MLAGVVGSVRAAIREIGRAVKLGALLLLHASLLTSCRLEYLLPHDQDHSTRLLLRILLQLTSKRDETVL